jgi:hypothetical protein
MGVNWKPPIKRPLKMKNTDAEEGDLEQRPASITDADLVNWFTYHPPREGQASRYEALRAQGLVFARLIYELTPPGADQVAAIRKVREAVFTANAAIACEHEVQTMYYSRKHERSEDPK